MRLPPLNSLRAFEAAARHMSLKKAATELHVTPAAISHQIKTLENAIGVAVFKRMPQHVELTPAGETLKPMLSEAFRQIESAVGAVERLEHNGEVTIASTPALAAKWLAPRLRRFSESHPDIDLNLSADAMLVDSIRDDAGESGSLLFGSDLAIRSGHGKYEGSVVHHLFSAYVIPMCSPKLLESGRPLANPDDLKHHALLHHETGMDQTDAERLNWDVWLKAANVQGINTNRGPTFNQVGLALDAAVEGLGVVLGIPVVASADLEAGRLIMPFPLGLKVSPSYYLVHSRNSASDPNVIALRDWILGEAAREKWVHPPRWIGGEHDAPDQKPPGKAS